jgi:nicotinamidase-related amidase
MEQPVSDPLSLDASTTALVLIDLQRGIMAMPVAPHAATDVLARAIQLANACRKARSPVVLVRVSVAADGADALTQPRDIPANSARPDGWDVLSPELATSPSDIIITKHQWGAFYGTELDLQLRRRGIRTIILGGISTNIGVESTARDAFERGYSLVFAEDAMSASSAEGHTSSCQNIFPRIGHVRSTAEVLAALGGR